MTIILLAAATANSVPANPTTKFQQAVLEDNPYAFYPLNETSGTTAFDMSGNNRNGTYGTNISLAQNSLLSTTSKYPYLPGTAAGVINISAAANFITTTWTVECWINISAFTNTSSTTKFRTASIISNGTTDTSHLNIAAANTTNTVDNCFWYQPSSGGDKYTSANTIPSVGTSTHLVITYNSGSLSYYLNGNLVQTLSNAINATANSTLNIGGAGWVCGPLEGYIGEFAVYSTALTAARIAAHYLAV
jgi:hypothetical protein